METAKHQPCKNTRHVPPCWAWPPARRSIFIGTVSRGGGVLSSLLWLNVNDALRRVSGPPKAHRQPGACWHTLIPLMINRQPPPCGAREVRGGLARSAWSFCVWGSLNLIHPDASTARKGACLPLSLFTLNEPEQHRSRGSEQRDPRCLILQRGSTPLPPIHKSQVDGMSPERESAQ